jgi:ferredoxin-NADP reductase
VTDSVPNAHGPLPWRRARVVETVAETPHAKTLRLEVPGWPGHMPGQHVDVRLTADDGYQTSRSYSIASAPEAAGPSGRIELTIERLDDGEVSPYLVDELRAGDLLELRGPLGGHFVWNVDLGGPLLLVAGGSGLVPLMAMLRHRAAAGREPTPTRLLHSTRSLEEALYREELAQLGRPGSALDVVYTLTRQAPPEWSGYRRRVDREMLAAVAFQPTAQLRLFVCGPTPMVEVAAAALVELGHAPANVKTERFGPTGGPAS